MCVCVQVIVVWGGGVSMAQVCVCVSMVPVGMELLLVHGVCVCGVVFCVYVCMVCTGLCVCMCGVWWHGVQGEEVCSVCVICGGMVYTEVVIV